jgi:hypothetical protein
LPTCSDFPNDNVHARGLKKPEFADRERVASGSVLRLGRERTTYKSAHGDALAAAPSLVRRNHD